MNLRALLTKNKEFVFYTITGGTATIADWTTFALITTYLHIHYETALVIAYATGGVVHYIANKLFTFECRSKKIGSQLAFYCLAAGISLSLNMAILGVLIAHVQLNQVVARIITTALMLLPNYLLHKNITFNRKLFPQHQHLS